MKNVSVSLIKELRLRTGVSFVECKRALLEENGDIELSIDNLRKAGMVTAAKKNTHVTNQGVIFAFVKNDAGVMLELNCETDFVTKNKHFINLGKKIISTALDKNIKDINQIKSIFELERTELVFRLNENININRFNYLHGKNIVAYVHSFRIGVLVHADNLDQKMLKNIAMHIAASKPQYLYPENVSKSVFNREYNIQIELSKTLNKPSNIIKKIVSGRMKKFVNSISLTGQNFIINPAKTVGEILHENNASVISFIRFEIGEKII
ncbi:MAG: elongation factor Ts [Buchnera aphidicola (Pentalonia nigronervosa)]|jgi:elongation factor Ts|uniref:Elongation factor Ts n=1 Tax=Buchnera aphidicola (Pentalonia nigronervosa) TaxID=1309793 RepID=A0A7H1AZN5_9GAMM|nr:MAG: elongation factor Ts [Buchnera aphidicola (Pentalonia nigronervosa)]